MHKAAEALVLEGESGFEHRVLYKGPGQPAYYASKDLNAFELLQELIATLLSCVRSAQGRDDANGKALQGMYTGIQMALLRYIRTEAVSEDDCELIVTLLVDKGQDSGREAGPLVQLALEAFDAGAVCALRLIPQLLQQPPSDHSAGGHPAGLLHYAYRRSTVNQ